MHTRTLKKSTFLSADPIISQVFEGINPLYPYARSKSAMPLLDFLLEVQNPGIILEYTFSKHRPKSKKYSRIVRLGQGV